MRRCTKGGKRYRYYTCVGAQKRGWQTCPSKAIPAAEIEAMVLGDAADGFVGLPHSWAQMSVVHHRRDAIVLITG
jgi:hypothetical protein